MNILNLSEHNMQRAPAFDVIPLPEGTQDKKITATLPILLKNGDLLLQHQTGNTLAINTFEYLTFNFNYKFYLSYYSSKTKKTTWLNEEKPYQFSELPRCYLPSSPLMQSLQSEISNIHYDLKILMANATNQGQFSPNYLRVAQLEENQYALTYSQNNRLTFIEAKGTIVSTTNTIGFAENIKHVVALSPQILCVSTKDALYRLEKDKEWSSHPLQILSARHRHYLITHMCEISEEEVLLFMNNPSAMSHTILIKFNVITNSIVHESSLGSCYRTVRLLKNSSLVLIGESFANGNMGINIYDHIENKLFLHDPSTDIVSKLFYETMDDGRVLLQEDSNKIILARLPAIDHYLQVRENKTEQLRLALRDHVIPELSEIVIQYVGGKAISELSLFAPRPSPPEKKAEGVWSYFKRFF